MARLISTNDPSAVRRFWAKVNKTDGCWLWTASTGTVGYGNFTHKKNRVFTCEGAHRFSYRLRVGPIPLGMFVCHRCDVRTCVRPDHLFLGTQGENVRDAAMKGRLGVKLNRRSVEGIKIMLRAGVARKAIASRFGVSDVLIGLIHNGKIWKHVPNIKESDMPAKAITMYQCYCDIEDCDVPGPMAATMSGALWDAQMVGWTACFGVTICPRCSENGRLPSDTDDLRVTIPATPDNAVVVVTDDDTEGV